MLFYMYTHTHTHRQTRTRTYICIWVRVCVCDENFLIRKSFKQVYGKSFVSVKFSWNSARWSVGGSFERHAVFQHHFFVPNSSTAEFSEVPDSSAAEKISRHTDSVPSLSSFKLYLGGWREN